MKDTGFKYPYWMVKITYADGTKKYYDGRYFIPKGFNPIIVKNLFDGWSLLDTARNQCPNWRKDIKLVKFTKKIPQLKTFNIVSVWEMSNTTKVQAFDLPSAIEMIEKNHDLVGIGRLVADSFGVVYSECKEIK